MLTVSSDSEGEAEAIEPEPRKRRYRTKHGTLAEMDAAEIGKRLKRDRPDPRCDRSESKSFQDCTPDRANGPGISAVGASPLGGERGPPAPAVRPCLSGTLAAGAPAS